MFIYADVNFSISFPISFCEKSDVHSLPFDHDYLSKYTTHLYLITSDVI